jgi:alpha-mannosidase
VQAQTLFAMLDPGSYPSEAFNAAWREVILYDEHTWGAHNSISEPESEFALGQWKIKQAFALEADCRSRELLDAALEPCKPVAAPETVLVFNTCSWPRTDVVTLPRDWTTPGDLVKDDNGREIPSQRLSTGELVFVAHDVPASGAARFTVHAGTGGVPGTVQADANAASLATDEIQVTIDKATGAIDQLKWAGVEADLAGGDEALGLNDYFYVAGRDPKDPQRNGPVTITVKEDGPVLASLLVESDAPGCEGLSREIRLIAGLDRVDIINIVDKTNVYDPEGVHFAFPFNVPEGVMRMDTPWAVVRPEADQLPGSCKNYFTVQRWVDVSNQDFGVTWATVDAPLIEVGAITADPRSAVGWIKRLEPTSTFYSYVMNNYWETNYKASQEGPTPFRYSIRPHRRFDSAAAARFGVECSQPLIPVPMSADTFPPPPLVQVEPSGVVVAALKPSADGKAYIVRLFGASGKPEHATLTWRGAKQPKIWRSNLAEEKVSRIEGPVPVPPYGLVTLRVQRGGA